MEYNIKGTESHGQLKILEEKLVDWIELHNGTGLDLAKEGEYKALLARIMELLAMEDNGVLDAIIQGSAIASEKIRSVLMDETKDMDESVTEKLQHSITAIVAFEARTSLLEVGGNEGIKSENHIRLILKTITQKNGLLSAADLEENYNAYVNGRLDLGPEKDTPTPTGAGTQVNIDVAAILKGVLGKHFPKNIFRNRNAKIDIEDKTKKRRLPIELKFEFKKIMLTFAYYPNKLTTPVAVFDTEFVAKMFSQSSILSGFGNEVKTSLSMLNINKGFPDVMFKGVTFSMSLNLGKFSQQANDLLDKSDKGSPPDLKIDPAAFSGKLSFTPNAILDILGIPPDAIIANQISLSGGFHVFITLDGVELFKRVLERGNKEALKKIVALEAQSEKVLSSAEHVATDGAKLQEYEKKYKKDPTKGSSKVVEQRTKFKDSVKNLRTEIDKFGEITKDIEKGVKSGKYPKITGKMSSSIRTTTAQAARRSLVRGCGSLVGRLIPIINAICTMYDIYCMMDYVFGLSNSITNEYGLSNLDIRKEERRLEQARKFREEANSDYQEKKFVILEMYTLLPMYDEKHSGTTLAGPLRYPLHLKFYEDGEIGKAYFEKGDYKDRYVSEGSCSVGGKVTVDMSYIKIDNGLGIAADNIKEENLGKLDLRGRDEQCFESHRHYKYMMAREELARYFDNEKIELF